MEDNNWMNHPSLKGIDKTKLQILLALTEQSQSKSQKELLPFLLAAASQSKSKGVKFTPDEVDTIINVMKEGKSKEELARMEKVRNMMKMMQ